MADPITSLEINGVALRQGLWYYLKSGGFVHPPRGIETRVYPTMASPTGIYTMSTAGKTNAGMASLTCDGTVVYWIEYDAALQAQTYVYKYGIIDSGGAFSNTGTIISVANWASFGLVYHPTTNLLYAVQRVDNGLHSGVRWFTDTLYSMAPGFAGGGFTALWSSATGPKDDSTHIDADGVNALTITPTSIFGMSERTATSGGAYGVWRFDVNTATMYLDLNYPDPVQPGGLIGTPANTLVFDSDVIDGNSQVQEFYANLDTTSWTHRTWGCSSVVGDYIGPGWQAVEGNFSRQTMSNGTDIFEWPGGTTPARPANDDFAAAIDLGSGASGSSALISNNYATTEASEPVPTNGPGDGPWLSLWWKWTCPIGFSGTISFDTFNGDAHDRYGDDMDTVLAAYTGSTLAGLTEIASNDDHSGGSSSFMSQITFTPTPGTAYWLQLSTYTPEYVGHVEISWAP